MPRAESKNTLFPMAIDPLCGVSRPATARSRVVFPLPEGPSRATTSPAGTASETPLSISLSPRRRAISLITRSAMQAHSRPDRDGEADADHDDINDRQCRYQVDCACAPGGHPKRTNSAGKTAAIQECLLFGRRGTAEHGIAVREAPEAADNIGVYFRPFQPIRIARRLVKGDAALLVGNILGMFEGQIEEAAQFLRDLAVEAADDGSGGYRARQGVSRKCARVATKHVPRKLVEQYEQGKRAVSGKLPTGKLARGGGLVGCKKPSPDLFVEGRILFEPAIVTGLTPER